MFNVPKKIFIIEDDANILSGLQAKFSLIGYLVKTHSGNEKIEIIVSEIKKEMPDFIILDLILPRVDGFELLKLLKKSDEIAGATIFVFTNLSDQDSRGKGLNLGAKYYFLKEELSLDGLVEKVERIIQNREKIII